MSRFFPQYYTESVSCIGEVFLARHDIRAILLDIDNTISLVDDPLPTPEALLWIRRMRARGYALGLVSNNDPPRVESLAQALELPFVAHAQKPSPDGFLSLARRLEASPECCLVVGDQLFTDIWGGNRARMRTVVVEPLQMGMEPRNFRWRRRLEQLVLAAFKRLHRNSRL